MAVQTRTIKRRIKSVKNTKKITKAMELVAASKMRKAMSAVTASRPYAELARDTIWDIVDATEATHALLQTSEDTNKTLVLLITSDRGLAGGFNSNIIKKAIQHIEGLEDVDAVCVGKRGTVAMQKRDINVIASFTDITNNPTVDDIRPIGNMLVEAFATGKYARVTLIYTDFKSALTQVPVVLPLLPVARPEEVEELGKIDTQNSDTFDDAKEYLFEPNAQTVLDALLPRIVDTMVYQAVLESAASEHSARMMAMKNASDSAGDMIEDLTFLFNQARQASITQEIAEISSGKAALE